MIKNSDLVVGNLETPISKDTRNFTKEKYCFASPFEFAKAMYDAGIKCVSTANNHCLDRGIEGIQETIDCLDEIGIIHTGTYKKEKEKEQLIIELEGIKIGILSYTYGTNAFSNKYYLNKKEKYSVNLFQNQELSNPITRYCYYHKNFLAKVYNKINRKLVKVNANCQVYERKEFDFIQKRKLLKEIRDIKNKTDIVVMLAHIGGQYNKRETERTKELCDYLLENGVNIVVGNHEHVIHGGKFENLKHNKLATYALGNFDGTAGVCEEPFDKKSEYSIAWNVYISKEDNEILFNKTTFSVLKTIKDERGCIQTIPLYKLIQEELNEVQKESLIKDMYEITYKFSNKIYKEIKVEYEI